MNVSFLATVLFGTTLLQGCATNCYLPRSTGPIPAIEPDLTAFVTNPELEPEMGILRQSGIVRLTDDPHAPVQLTLRACQIHPRCGMPCLASALTLGVIPVAMPASCTYAFTLETPDGARVVRYELSMYERLSIWERIFRIFHSNVETQAMALKIAAARTVRMQPE